jgi:hypothetical protein
MLGTFDPETLPGKGCDRIHFPATVRVRNGYSTRNGSECQRKPPVNLALFAFAGGLNVEDQQKHGWDEHKKKAGHKS